MKHHIKLRHTGRYETDCGKMIRDKNEVTSSRMDTDCPDCIELITGKIHYLPDSGMTTACGIDLWGKKMRVSKVKSDATCESCIAILNARDERDLNRYLRKLL